MAERTSNFTTEAYLVASQARLNLIFDKFWAQLAARQMVTSQPVQHTAKPEKSQTYLHSPAKHPKLPSTQINLRRPRKKLRKLKIHMPVSPWRLAKPGGKHMAANSTDNGQAKGTLTPTTAQDGRPMCRSTTRHSGAVQPHTLKKGTDPQDIYPLQSKQRPPHRLGIG
ncbi:Hypothetical predicted protein [Pelobates cultripes]|uniref:Uncharacterized protein n=1 Tax=Pelobates cultripes TaxID=61616 RepID=A0AAD1VLF9_PELCU|nr:Hypothetical predicted protein [Pelobates cultripes]